jgi:hypothetical protein
MNHNEGPSRGRWAKAAEDAKKPPHQCVDCADTHGDQADPEHDELVRLRVQSSALTVALVQCAGFLGYALDDGMLPLHDHDDGCSEDSECDCSIRPACDVFNAAMAAAEKALGRAALAAATDGARTKSEERGEK